MYRLTKVQHKNMERIGAWLRGEPFKENSRDKSPVIPELSRERVLGEWLPSWDPKETGQFFTPLEMGQVLLGRFRLGPDDRVLEPCAGIGHLLYQLAEAGCISVDAYEASSECVEIGRRLFPWANWQNEIPFEHLPEIEGQYDVVVMNPPFGTTWAMGAGLTMSEGRGKRSEHIFMELATRALKPGGQAAVIGPYNLLERMPKAMREWFDSRMVLDDSFGPLPGEFGLTGIKVHAFYFTRLEEPVIETAAPAAVPSTPDSEGLSLVIDQAVLAEALTLVSAAASKKSPVTALRNVLLATEGGRLKLQTNCLDLSITTWVTPAAIGQEGMIAAPAHFLAELVHSLPEGYVSLAIGPSERADMFGTWLALKVRGGTYQSSVRAMNGEECPLVKRPEGTSWLIPTAQLAGMLKQVTHYADSKGECGLPVLGGVLFRVSEGQLTVVASNRMCLAISREGAGLDDTEIVVPMQVLAVAVRHLKRTETVELVLSEKSVMFKFPDLEIVGHLMGESFPDYTKIIPTGCQTEVWVDGEELLDMVNLARRFNELGAITLQVSGNGNGSGLVTVRNGEAEVGDYSGSLRAVVAGEPAVLMFRGEQLAKGITALGKGEIRIALNDEATPAVLQAGGSQQVIQPIKR